jgi:hypothetical protein
VIYHGDIHAFGRFGIRTITAINDANWAIGSLENLGQPAGRYQRCG